MDSYATPANLFKAMDYSPALAHLVVLSIAGGQTLTATCSQPGFPSPWVLRRWCRENPELAEDIQTAQYVRAHVLVDEAQAIADDATGDYRTVTRRDGRQEEVFDHENVARSKLKVDVRKWIAGKLNRAAWGESKQIDIDAKVLTVSLSEEQLDKRLHAATEKLRTIAPNLLISNDTGQGA